MLWCSADCYPQLQPRIKDLVGVINKTSFNLYGDFELQVKCHSEAQRRTEVPSIMSTHYST